MTEKLHPYEKRRQTKAEWYRKMPLETVLQFAIDRKLFEKADATALTENHRDSIIRRLVDHDLPWPKPGMDCTLQCGTDSHSKALLVAVTMSKEDIEVEKIPASEIFKDDGYEEYDEKSKAFADRLTDIGHKISEVLTDEEFDFFDNVIDSSDMALFDVIRAINMKRNPQSFTIVEKGVRVNMKTKEEIKI